MNITSPSKRRALGPVDANSRSPLSVSRLSPSKLDLSKTRMVLGSSPIKPSTIKRPIEQENNPETPISAKKRRLSGAGSEKPSPHIFERSPRKQVVNDTPRPRSISPEDSSVFDNSTTDITQVTAISEPDVESATSLVTENSSRPRSMTREEARQKAEIIRLRLGLAGYKVKTNQADVPLEKLQMRPLSPRFSKQTQSTVSLPPVLSTPQRSIAQSPKDEEAVLSESERSDGWSSRKVLPPAPVQISPCRETGSSFTSTEMNRSPVRGHGQEAGSTLPPLVVNTPRRGLDEEDDDLIDNERGGAAKGLLVLSQSSPASGLIR